MPNIRKFYLQNASGERFPLQGERGVYFTLPEGLGYELAPVFGDLGRGFFSILDDEAEPQGAVAGTLVFTDGAYQNYRTFVDWLAAAGSLLLIYCPFGDREYQKAVAVQYLQKGELDHTRLLHSPFALTSLSPWRLPTPTEIILGAGYADRRGRYSGRYPGRYGQDAAGVMTARIAASGHLPGALRLRYTGGISSPELRLTGAVSGTVCGSCRLTGVSIGSTDTLELLTFPEDSHIRKISADGTVTDLLPYADLSRNPFPRVPFDEPAVFSITSAQSFSGRAELLIYYFFRSV